MSNNKDLREKAVMRLHKAAARYGIAPAILIDWYSEDLEEIAHMPYETLKAFIENHLWVKGIPYETRSAN